MTPGPIAVAMHAISTLLNKSRKTITADTELRNDDGKIVARVIQTGAVLNPRL